MNETDSVNYLRVNIALEENNKQFKLWHLNAIMCENEIKTNTELIKQQIILVRDKVNKLKLQRKRAIENAKISNDKLDELLAEKEELHIELKKISNLDKVVCEFCDRYYSSTGIARHKRACISNPKVKKIAKHKEELEAEKKKRDARKKKLEGGIKPNVKKRV
ncbi:hypothetical protein LCGC14_1046920 [marine sediment metagenome]|uniref:Uncharacterized protein n=1 Tax=marine sediment metagenome TaxID=412755 RepID=A0A0F9MUI1_9ZZZZ